jgi:hypothetical protein
MSMHHAVRSHSTTSLRPRAATLTARWALRLGALWLAGGLTAAFADELKFKPATATLQLNADQISAAGLYLANVYAGGGAVLDNNTQTLIIPVSSVSNATNPGPADVGLTPAAYLHYCATWTCVILSQFVYDAGEKTLIAQVSCDGDPYFYCVPGQVVWSDPNSVGKLGKQPLTSVKAPAKPQPLKLSGTAFMTVSSPPVFAGPVFSWVRGISIGS